jgi:glyoxylase-like metal-dependent hydrolase (beta-lactamase superfamily II)
MFEEANVVHMGDIFFNGAFPFVDVEGGGSLDGYIAAQTLALEHIPADATVIPGHGALATPADLAATRDALVEFRTRLEPLAASDMTLEEIVAAEPLADYDSWGAGFISTEAFVTMAVGQLRGE